MTDKTLMQVCEGYSAAHEEWRAWIDARVNEPASAELELRGLFAEAAYNVANETRKAAVAELEAQMRAEK